MRTGENANPSARPWRALLCRLFDRVSLLNSGWLSYPTCTAAIISRHDTTRRGEARRDLIVEHLKGGQAGLDALLVVEGTQPHHRHAEVVRRLLRLRRRWRWRR
jgi:hypothetical protein